MELAIKLKNVYKLFPLDSGKNKFNLALQNLNLELEKESFTVICGANGSGKSVLMNIIANLMEVSDGEVFTSSKVGLVFQDSSLQILGDTPREDVAVGPRNLKFDKNKISQIVEESLKKVSLLDKADFPCDFLSGGEKRRLAVASILAMNRDIIIFDEPYANLDFPGVKEVNSLLQYLKSQKKTIILLTHELEKCLALANHFVVLYKGEKVFDGNPNQALKLSLENWGIKNPLSSYSSLENLVWL